MDGNQRLMVSNIVLATGVGLLLAGGYLVATGTTLVGAALMVAGVGDLIAWQVLRRTTER